MRLCHSEQERKRQKMIKNMSDKPERHVTIQYGSRETPEGRIWGVVKVVKDNEIITVTLIAGQPCEIVKEDK